MKAVAGQVLELDFFKTKAHPMKCYPFRQTNLVPC